MKRFLLSSLIVSGVFFNVIANASCDATVTGMCWGYQAVKKACGNNIENLTVNHANSTCECKCPTEQGSQTVLTLKIYH